MFIVGESSRGVAAQTPRVGGCASSQPWLPAYPTAVTKSVCLIATAARLHAKRWFRPIDEGSCPATECFSRGPCRVAEAAEESGTKAVREAQQGRRRQRHE